MDGGPPGFDVFGDLRFKGLSGSEDSAKMRNKPNLSKNHSNHFTNSQRNFPNLEKKKKKKKKKIEPMLYF
jgi:hypothetical protein